jgi:hypothetical protein
MVSDKPKAAAKFVPTLTAPYKIEIINFAVSLNLSIFIKFTTDTHPIQIQKIKMKIVINT